MVTLKIVRMNLKQAALLAAVGTGLSTLASSWRAAVSIPSITYFQPGWMWWIAPLIAASAVLDMLLPFFYFALFRSESQLSFPKWSRTLSLLVASTGAAVLFVAALDFVHRRRSPTPVQYLNLSAELCCALLLFQVQRSAFVPDPTLIAGPRTFSFVTKAAGFWGGLCIAGYGLQVVAAPFVYAIVRHIAYQNVRRLPPFADILAQKLEMFVDVLSLWVLPWIVYTTQKPAEMLAPLWRL